MRITILLAILLTALVLALGGCSDGRSFSAPIVEPPPTGTDPTDPPPVGDGEGGEMWVLEGAPDNPGSGRPWLLLVLFEDGDYLLGYDASPLGLEDLGAERGRIEVDPDAAERLLLLPDAADTPWLIATFDLTAIELDDDSLRLLDADGVRFELDRQDRDPDQPPAGGWAQRYGDDGAAALALLADGAYLYARAEGSDTAFERGLYAYSAVNDGFDILEIAVSSNPEAGFASAPGPKRLVIGDNGISVDYLNDDSSVSLGELCRGCPLPTSEVPPRFGSGPIDTPVEPLFAAVSGTVFDDLDARLAGVTVTAFAGGLEASATTTDDEGRYQLTVPADQGIVSLQARAPVPQVIENFDPTEHIGFGNALAVLEPEDGLEYQQNFVIRRERTLELRMSRPGFMALGTADGTVFIDGLPDSMNIVGGSARAFSPTYESGAFPGAFATRQAGFESGLFSIGFASVNLLQQAEDGSVVPAGAIRDEAGQPALATLRFEIHPDDWPALQDGDDFSHLPSYVEDPERIRVPLYFYDEVLGDWILNATFGWLESDAGVVPPEALTAIRDGDFSGPLYMVGEVEHFSFWNVDIPNSTSCVVGRIVDAEGEPISGANVNFFSTPSDSSDFSGQLSTFTDANGAFEEAVPASEAGPEDDWNRNDRVDTYRVGFTVTAPAQDSCGVGAFGNFGPGWRTPTQAEVDENGCKDLGTFMLDTREPERRTYALEFLSAADGTPLTHAAESANDPLNYARVTLEDRRVPQGSPAHNCACAADSDAPPCVGSGELGSDGTVTLTPPVLDDPESLAVLYGRLEYVRQRPDLGVGARESAVFPFTIVPSEVGQGFEVALRIQGAPQISIITPEEGDSFLFDDEIQFEGAGQDPMGIELTEESGAAFIWYRGLFEDVFAQERSPTVTAWQALGVGEDRVATLEGIDRSGFASFVQLDGLSVASVEVSIDPPSRTELVTAEQLPLTAQVTGANDTSVLWSSSDLTIASVASDGTVTATGGGSVTVTARSQVNPDAHDTLTLMVENLTADFVATPSNGSTATLFSFDASAADGDIASYAWDFGDGNVATGLTATHQYADAGNYAVVLTVTSTTGASRSSSPTSITVVDEDEEVPPNAQIAVEPSAGIAPVSVQFDGSASTAADDATIESYVWDFGDGSGTTGMTAAHTYAEPGTYTATLTVTDDRGLTDSASVSIQAFTGPTAAFSYNPQAGAPPLEVTFNAAASTTDADQITAYQWDFGDGSAPISGPDLLQVSHVYAATGTFTATLTVVDSAGGQDSSAVPVGVIAPGDDDEEIDESECTLPGPGVTTVNNVAQLEALSGICVIEGSLVIQRSFAPGGEEAIAEITSLAPLSDLRRVNGGLTIARVPNLPFLNGLGNLRRVGGQFSLQENEALVSLAGLDRLEETGNFRIIDNPALQTLAAPDTLTGISGDLIVRDNASLASLDGLENIQALAALTVINNPTLADVTSLSSLETVEADVTITGNPQLTSLDGLGQLQQVRGLSLSGTFDTLVPLQALETVSGRFQVHDSPNLELLGPLPSLSSVDRLELSNNDALTSLEGLIGSTGFVSVIITGNAQLATLTGLEGVQELGFLSISQNPSLENLNGLSNLERLVSNAGGTGNASLTNNESLADISSLSSLQSVAATLGFSQLPALSSMDGLEALQVVGTLNIIHLESLNDLSAMGQLADVSNDMTLRDLPQLAELTGLEGLERVGFDLTLENIPLLTSLSGLSGLEEVGRRFWIRGLQALTSLAALTELRSIGGSATSFHGLRLSELENLDDLTLPAIEELSGTLQLQELSAITDLSDVGAYVGMAQSINISRMPALTDLSGLEAVTTIEGMPSSSLTIRENPVLTTVNGLDNLTLTHALNIALNPALVDLSGLNGLERVEQNFFINSNESLALCEAERLLALVESRQGVGGFVQLTDLDEAAACD